MHTARHLAVILVGAVVLGAAGMGMAQMPPPSDASNAVLQAMLAVEHDFIQQNAQLKHAGATLKAAASGAHADQAALHAIDDNARLRWENVMLKAKGQPDRTQALAQIQQDIAQLRQENAALLQGNDQLTAALQNPPPQQASDSDNYVQDPPADPVRAGLQLCLPLLLLRFRAAVPVVFFLPVLPLRMRVSSLPSVLSLFWMRLFLFLQRLLRFRLATAFPRAP